MKLENLFVWRVILDNTRIKQANHFVFFAHPVMHNPRNNSKNASNALSANIRINQGIQLAKVVS